MKKKRAVIINGGSDLRIWGNNAFFSWLGERLNKLSLCNESGAELAIDVHKGRWADIDIVYLIMDDYWKCEGDFVARSGGHEFGIEFMVLNDKEIKEYKSMKKKGDVIAGSIFNP